MKELEYPFDSAYLIAKKNSIKKQLLSSGQNFIDKRIAILGGFTTSNIKLMLELFLLNEGIRPDFYESEYNQYYQDAVFPNEALENFAPDFIYICTSNKNIETYPELSDSVRDVDTRMKDIINKFTAIWDQLYQTYHCPIIQNNFEMPYCRMLGNRDAYDYRGAVNFLTRLNMEFYRYAQLHENFYICDINYLSADYGLRKWYDPFYWYLYKYAVSVPAIPYLSFNVANIIKAILGKNKKGLVLDLDNTLWGGVIGEDGAENIVLGPENAEGQGFLDFQKYIKRLQKMGILLTINSKNEYSNAMAGLSHPNSQFRENDFISIKANWERKDRNFREIAEELQLLPESLVFLDDNPAERQMVTNQLPGVCAPELKDVAYYIELVDRSAFFETAVLSPDDLKRNRMYQENAERIKQCTKFTDYGEYLDSLEMTAEIQPFVPVYYARVSQLSNKSNQFNLTTKRYTQADIEDIAQNKEYLSLYGKLQDKFGDNGVVSVVIGHLQEQICHIESWLMSCRVLKRDMEYAMMDVLVHVCQEKDISEMVGYYYPTEKNSMVREFYQKMGFTKQSEDQNGNSIWKFCVQKDYRNKNKHIKVKEK